MIDNHSITSGSSSSRQRAESLSSTTGDKSKADISKKAQSSDDSVKLSQQAQTLVKLENSINEASGVDQEKVSAIKASIDDGSYQVNLESLADKLLSE